MENHIGPVVGEILSYIQLDILLLLYKDNIPVLLRNRLLYGGLAPVLSQTEKS